MSGRGRNKLWSVKLLLRPIDFAALTILLHAVEKLCKALHITEVLVLCILNIYLFLTVTLQHYISFFVSLHVRLLFFSFTATVTFHAFLGLLLLLFSINCFIGLLSTIISIDSFLQILKYPFPYLPLPVS